MLITFSRLSIFALMLLGLGWPAWGHSLVFEDSEGQGLFVFKVPAGWSVALDGDRIHLVSSDTGEYVAAWSITNLNELKTGRTYLKTFLDTFYQDYRLDPAEEAVFHGMPLLFQRGEGHREGRLENFSFTLFEPRKGRLCFAVRLGRQDKNDDMLRNSIYPFPEVK